MTGSLSAVGKFRKTVLGRNLYISLDERQSIINEFLTDIGTAACDPFGRDSFLLIADQVHIFCHIFELIRLARHSAESDHLPSLAGQSGFHTLCSGRHGFFLVCGG